ncbi:MAG: streptomycin biosynthesis enzyme StrG [Williamsia sp.]|nr:streptomycin biosynthesis enzyme StrG [Williamsia sp.]
MLKHSIIVDYDTGRYPFQKVLAALFRVPVLDKLHTTWKQRTAKAGLTYDDNLLLRKKMQGLKEDALFYTVYHRWITDVLSPHYGGHISYSAHPKMRVHLARTGSVSNFHRDADVTGRAMQINCYLPFTDVFDSNTLWCESDYGLKDYKPINLRYGQAILWDGGYLTHGTVENETDFTRVSCDFRFQPKLPDRVSPPWSTILSGRDQSTTLDQTVQEGAREYGGKM